METGSAERVLEMVRSIDCGAVLDSRLDTLGIDSLEFLGLIKDVEDYFCIRISDNDIIHLNTVADLAACVEAKCASLLPD